jgi:glycosyltransferase involved in cell wall biosynthesis
MAIPLFTIILPTRNRAELLRTAIQSVLWQTLPDFELLIYDNASEDSTPEVVREFEDHRITYVRAPRWVNPPQQIYEQSFKLARGQFLHTIGDDDALFPHCLERAKFLVEKHAAQLLCFSTKCFYYYPDWIAHNARNSVVCAKFTSSESILDSRAELKSLFDLRFSSERHPNVTNSFFRKQDVEELMAIYGQVLLDEQMGDISIAVFLLNLIDRYLLVDEPLQLGGFSGRSNSANQMIFDRPIESLNEEFRTWFSDKAKMERFLDGVPIKIPFWFNFQTATMLRQKALLTLPFEINWTNYFKKMWRAITRLEVKGIDVTSAKLEFFNALGAQPFLCRFPVNAYVKARGTKRKKIGPPGRKDDQVIRGDQQSFGDILGAAKHWCASRGLSGTFCA